MAKRLTIGLGTLRCCLHCSSTSGRTRLSSKARCPPLFTSALGNVWTHGPRYLSRAVGVSGVDSPDSGTFDGLHAVADRMAADGMTVDEPYRDERIRSPLHWSIQARNDLALEWLIKRITKLDQVDYNGDTPLYESVIFGNRPAFTRLLTAGAQLRPKHIVFEKSPMLQVLVHPDGSWLQSALARVENGSLALDSWCPLVYWLSGDVERSLESVELLMARGAQAVCRNGEGILTLEAAAESQSLNVMHRLLKTHPPLGEADRNRIDRVLRERNDPAIIRLFRGWQAAL